MPLVRAVMELYGRKEWMHLTSLQKSDNSTQHTLKALRHQTAGRVWKRVRACVTKGEDDVSEDNRIFWIRGPVQTDVAVSNKQRSFSLK